MTVSVQTWSKQDERTSVFLKQNICFIHALYQYDMIKQSKQFTMSNKPFNSTHFSLKRTSTCTHRDTH